MCFHLHWKNEATGILIVVRSSNEGRPSPIALFLLCLSCFTDLRFRISCVNAGFNCIMESDKQWHAEVFILFNMYGIPIHIDFTVCLVLFIYLFILSI